MTGSTPEYANSTTASGAPRLKRSWYEKELRRLQAELVKMQYAIRTRQQKVVVLFEGRDAAGKGGVIKRISERTNPRIVRTVALGTPTDREKTQWYFQRYVGRAAGRRGDGPVRPQLVQPRRGRAGHGVLHRQAVQEFMRSCPEFERMLVRSGIILVKYWFSVSDEEQERRFQERINDPVKRWKLSPMDLESRSRWLEYSRAKDEMFRYTDHKQAPWWVVDADDKRRARLNCIRHLLEQVPYGDLPPEQVELPPRVDHAGYVRPPMDDQTFVPDRY